MISLPQSQSLDLPMILEKGNMVPTKRRKAQAEFVTDVKRVVEDQFQAKGLPKSDVIACLCRGLTNLASEPTDRRFGLVISDMIVNTPQLSFYHYGGKILEHYDRLKAAIDQKCPQFSGLSSKGIELVVVYLPRSDEEDVTRETRAFFDKYFTEQGVKIEFLPNLPAVKRSDLVSSAHSTNH